MAKYKLCNAAKDDLIRIHHYSVNTFGMAQADKYFESFFEYFDIMRTIRLILTFYNSFAFVSLMITLACLSIIYTWGFTTFVALFWFKIVTAGIIFYYINSFKKDVFYYYKNLGLTKKYLWFSSLTFDFVLFLILLKIALKIR